MSSTTGKADVSSSRIGLYGAFGLSILSILVAIIAWRQFNPEPLQELSVYDVFPVFGLSAFSLMWCMYTMSAASKYLELDGKSLKLYYRIAGYAILALILAHPLLLITSLWNDGFGLPPGSYQAYLGERLAWVALLGTGSLIVFLAYELHRWFGSKKWWKWIIYANDLAVLVIFYHGLRIGGELQTGWFRYVWFFYGVMLVIYIAYLRVYLPLKTKQS